MRYRTLLLAAASVAGLACSTAAFAQDAAAPGSDVEAVVVTGSRVARSRLETLAPVDVIDNKSLARQGNGIELGQALANLTPAISFPRPAITDGTDSVRPAILRGLAPDQTLVLINGVRGHIGALVNVNGSIGRGSTAFDLNTIPSVTLDRVEVLRDGASAQYGADAIAGVINLRLREARSGGSVTANWGMYDTDVDTARGSRKAHDGLTESLSGWVGLPLGAEGFLTLSGEAATRHATNRSDFVNTAAVPNYPANTVIGRFGDPVVKSGTIWANAGLPINESWSLYGFGGYQHRTSESAATARAYNNSGNVPAIYPGGYLPIIAPKIDDYTATGGIKGDTAGWHLDGSVSYGQNNLHYRVKNSVNTTYGAASQTNFDAGKLKYDQTLVDFNATRPLDFGLVEPMTLALGAEYRAEEFGITAGEPASYSKGPLSGSPASQGFGGFQPGDSGNFKRHNYSAYADLEGKLTEALSFGVAGRYEDYSDFGSKVTGKLSARYDFTPNFAIRGSVNNGVKAPALQQQYFSYAATNLVTTVVNGQTVSSLVQSGKFRVTSPAAIALGAKPLKPERSLNYSLGTVYHQGPFELTVDGYHIRIKDRIVLSDNLGIVGPNQSAALVSQIQSILAPYNVSAAQFFLNGVQTTTTGVDVVARYRVTTDSLGRFDLMGAGNYNKTKVDRTPDLPLITSISQPAFLFDRANVLSYEKGTPKTKFVESVDWTLENWGATVKATEYSNVLVSNNNASLDYNTGSATIVDLEGRYNFGHGVNLALGVNNVFDKYPNATPAAINSPTGSVGFPSYSPYGFNGRFLYGRVTYSW